MEMYLNVKARSIYREALVRRVKYEAAKFKFEPPGICLETILLSTLIDEMRRIGT